MLHFTEKGERDREKREIERRVPPRSSAITIRAPSVSPIRILSFRFLFNFLNTDACDPDIKEVKKKKLCDTEMRRRQTLRELPPVSFSFFHSFLDLGMGMKYELVLRNLVGLIFI